MSTPTPVLGLNEPTVGADTNVWGGLTNANWTTIDGLFQTGPFLKLANGGTGAGTAANARTNLGLGTAATQTIGTSGATVPLLSTANTWTLAQTFTAAPVFTNQSGSRTALGLGTSAVINTGTSGTTIPLLDGTNTWSNAQTFTAAPVFSNQSGTRTALGLGTAAVVNTGTSGGTIPLLNGANTFSGKNIFSDAIGTQVSSDPVTDSTQGWEFANSGRLDIYRAAASGALIQLGSNGDRNIQSFFRAGANVGNITVTAAGTNYGTTSLRSLKDNIVEADLQSAITHVKNIRLREFDWRSNGEHSFGVIADEIHQDAPVACTYDENGVPNGVDFSKMVPFLLGALQSALERIEALEAQ